MLMIRCRELWPLSSRLHEAGASSPVDSKPMKKIVTTLSILVLSIAITMAQPLVVKVSPLKVVGQKALVELTITNQGTNRIEAARAICFVQDQDGRMVGQSAKWVIGQNKTGVEPKGQAKFNFVITAPHPLVATNLTARVRFSRLILQDGKQVNPENNIIIIPPASKSAGNSNAGTDLPAK
jgi:hypothetical protein